MTAAPVTLATQRRDRRDLVGHDQRDLGVLGGPGHSAEPNIVTVTNNDGPGSLREAIDFANNNPDTTITFQIPSAGPSTVVTIDVGSATPSTALTPASRYPRSPRRPRSTA